MNFIDKIQRESYLDLTKKEILILTLLLVLFGIIFAITPYYSLIVLTGLIILTIGLIYPKQLFLSTGVFLIFQTAIVSNMVFVLGSPEEITNIINRIDEFIWALFIIYIIIIKYKGKNWQLKKTNLDSIIIIFVCIGFTSTLVNHNSILWSSVSILLALKGFFIYWISKNLSIDEHKVILFFKAIIYILVFTAILGILQYIGIVTFLIESGERFGVKVAQSIFAHHGTFGTLMAAGIALSVGLKLGTGKNKWLFITFILILGLLASTLRRSVIGILLGTLVVFINYKRFRIHKKYTYSFFGIILLTSLLLFARLSNMIERTQEEYSTSVHPRYFLYYGALKIIENKPFSGEGPGTYGSYVSTVIKSKIYQKYKIIVEDRYKMDTFWAMLLGEYGILGTTTFCWILLILFRTLLISFPKNDNKPFLKGLYIGYIILFVDYFVESFFTPIYSKSLFAFILFAGLGLLSELGNQSLQEESLNTQ